VWACKNYDGDVQSDIVAQGMRVTHHRTPNAVCCAQHTHHRMCFWSFLCQALALWA
jgi:hypothetical protein